MRSAHSETTGKSSLVNRLAEAGYAGDAIFALMENYNWAIESVAGRFLN